MLWSIVAVSRAAAAVISQHVLVICHFVLDFLEGAAVLGILLFLSFHHTLRGISVIFITLLAAAFSLSIARDSTETHRLRGVDSWSRIFVLEGLVTVSFAQCAQFFVNTWLERTCVIKNLRKRYVTENDQGNMSSYVDFCYAFKSLAVMVIFTLSLLSGVFTYWFAYLFPSIISEIGKTVAYAQLFGVLPFAVAFLYCLVCMYLHRRYQSRALVLITVLSTVLCVTGFGACLQMDASYGHLFLTIPGACGLLPLLSWWTVNGSATYNRRAMSSSAGRASVYVCSILLILLFWILLPPAVIQPSLAIFKILFSVFFLVPLIVILCIMHLSGARCEERLIIWSSST